MRRTRRWRLAPKACAAFMFASVDISNAANARTLIKTIVREFLAKIKLRSNANNKQPFDDTTSLRQLLIVE